MPRRRSSHEACLHISGPSAGNLEKSRSSPGLKISPFILSADFANLEGTFTALPMPTTSMGRDGRRVQSAQYLHRHPGKEVYPEGQASDMFLDVKHSDDHAKPVRYVEKFCDAGADLVTVHGGGFPKHSGRHHTRSTLGASTRQRSEAQDHLGGSPCPYIDQVESRSWS